MIATLAERAIDIAHNSTLSLLTMTCNDVQHCRTVPAIVLSCTSTIFLCTWVSLHPVVPRDPYEVWWKSLGKRISLMLEALFVPEVILTMAFKDWIESCSILRYIRDNHPECKWTEIHAQLLIMGGIQLVNEDGSMDILDSYSFRVPQSHIHMLTIPVEEIEDKSKGDFVSKAIVVIQTLWFTLQVMNRVNQGLTITELELTTLGHAVLNLFIYWCWWNKPMNLRFPFDVYPIKKWVEHPESDHRRGSRSQVEKVQEHTTLQVSPQWLTLRVRMGVYIFDNMWDGGRYFDFSFHDILVLLCGAIIGGIFGGIHCLAWKSQFPTHIESKLWQISAVIVTATPGIGLLLAVVIYRIHEAIGRQYPLNKYNYIQSYAIAVVYGLARMCLLLQGLLALRALPYKAYLTPSWTVYMPHIA